jgi:hypothetical protein
MNERIVDAFALMLSSCLIRNRSQRGLAVDDMQWPYHRGRLHRYRGAPILQAPAVAASWHRRRGARAHKCQLEKYNFQCPIFHSILPLVDVSRVTANETAPALRALDPPTCATLDGRLKLVDAPLRRPESNVAHRARHVSEYQDARCSGIRSAGRSRQATFMAIAIESRPAHSPGPVTVCVAEAEPTAPAMCQTIEIPRTTPDVRDGHGIYPAIPVIFQR